MRVLAECSFDRTSVLPSARDLFWFLTYDLCVGARESYPGVDLLSSARVC